MPPVYHRSSRQVDRITEDHTAEGVAILTDEPSRLIRATILVLGAMLVAAVVWSFFGRMDVIVQGAGTIKPETRESKVHVPIKGQIADIYVAEGVPVAAGDVLLRLNSPSAIELAGQATQAELTLASAEQRYRSYPDDRQAMEKELQAIREKLVAEQRDYDRKVAEDMAQLAEEQALKLEKARAKLAKAQEEADHAQRVVEQYERLFDSPGGGGVSGQQLEEKRKQSREKAIDLRLAEVELGEFEIELSEETAEQRAEIEKKSQELLGLEAKYQASVLQIAKSEQEVETELRMSRAKARSATQVRYKDIDDDNFLLIRAPVDGVVTWVTEAQEGTQVDDKSPVVTIAPRGVRKILEVEIAESDRAFLTPGAPVKVKVNAFSYQRYGFLDGELEYIAPSSHMSQVSKKIVYTGRIALDRDHFDIGGNRIPLHYGMAAQAEIVVRERRIIDLALDPLRNVAG